MSDMDKLRDSFSEESSDMLDQVEEILLQFTDDYQPKEELQEVYRVIHSIKGSSRMFNYNEVETFLHDIETHIDNAIKENKTLNASQVELLLRAVDEARYLLGKGTEERDDEGIHAVNRNSILEGLEDAFAGESGKADDTDSPAESQVRNFRIEMAFGSEDTCEEVDVEAILNDLDGMGNCRVEMDTSNIPPLDKIEPDKIYGQWTIWLETTASAQEDIEDAFLFVENQEHISIEELQGPGGQDPKDEPAANDSIEEDKNTVSAQKGSKSKTATEQKNIRVASEKLDKLLNLVGELVINQSRLDNQLNNINDPTLVSIKEENERLVKSLQDSVMGLRTLPINMLFLRSKRIIHDAAQELGKEVTPVFSGGENEIDKNLLESLYEPLTHLIRNALDHGIEPPEERSRANKDKTGTLEIKADQKGGEFILTISDDGEGIDPEKIKQKALETGIIETGQEYSQHEILQLIFHQGLSTSADVTNLSGRGVGLDVVKKALEAVNGRVKVDTEPGEGTTFELRLPMTLSIVDSLLIRSANKYYALPLTFIERVNEYSRDKLATRERPIIQYGGEFIPFVRIREVFNQPNSGLETEKMIVVHQQESEFGIVCDDVVGTIQAVIKPLDDMFGNVRAVSSATILGDGHVALILDVPTLAEMGRDIEQKYLKDLEENKDNHG